jgi:hypothetical protein
MLVRWYVFSTVEIVSSPCIKIAVTVLIDLIVVSCVGGGISIGMGMLPMGKQLT